MPIYASFLAIVMLLVRLWALFRITRITCRSVLQDLESEFERIMEVKVGAEAEEKW